MAELPSGYKSIRDSGRTITLTSEDMRWIPGGKRIPVRLAEATLDGGERVLLGSAIEGSLVKDAGALKKEKKPNGKPGKDPADPLFHGVIVRAVGNLSGNAVFREADTPHTVLAPVSTERSIGTGQKNRTGKNPGVRGATVYVMRLNGSNSGPEKKRPGKEEEIPVFIRVAVGPGKHESIIREKLSQ